MLLEAVAERADDFDVIHCHLDWVHLPLLRLRESPLANSVTSWPKPTNSFVNHETTRSVPPYNFGGTLSARGCDLCDAHSRFRAVEPARPFTLSSSVRPKNWGCYGPSKAGAAR
jgi:hypothetical protein